MKQIRNLKLRQLECFVEVARQRSVTGAAAALSLTQPAVTRAMRELEETLGAPLIEKQGRGIKLTQFGEIYVKFAGESLAALRRGAVALGDITAEHGPPLRIGALPTVSARIMPDAVAAFLQSPASAPLTITTGENLILLDKLRAGQLDLVVGRMGSPEHMQGLAFEPLYTEKVVLVVAHDHPILAQAQISLAALEGYPMLVPSQNSIIRPAAERLFVEQGMTPPATAIETVSESFGRVFTRKHRAIWIISEGVVAEELTDGVFKTLPIPTTTTLGSVGFNFNPSSKRSATAQLLMDLIAQQCKGLS